MTPLEGCDNTPFVWFHTHSRGLGVTHTPVELARRFYEGVPTCEPQPMATVRIKAEHVHDLGNGTYEVIVQGRPLGPNEEALLHSLFPNLSEVAYQLLAKEAILAAVV